MVERKIKLMKSSITLIVILTLGIVSMVHSQNNSTIITAHRGASGYAPENTISSIKLAVEMKAEFSEIDAQETLDGEIILLHDNSLKRTAGVDKNIWEKNYTELADLDAGSWFDEKYKDEKIPTLAEVIDYSKNKIALNIELKTNGHEQKLAERVVKIVAEKDFADNCILTSFDYKQILRVKEINPKLKVGLIFSSYPKEFDVFEAPIEVLSVNHTLVNKEFMKKAFESGKEVHVWTVNDEEMMQELFDLNVTSIITNYPDRARKFVE